MPDVSPERRRVMQAVKGRDTNPEKFVRKIAHNLGYRYRLHRRDLPGKPDLVFASRRKIIFVHGCFWHGHNCKRGARTPKTNRPYWSNKIKKNKERDHRVRCELVEAGWEVLTLWECRLKDADYVKSAIANFLESE